MQFVGALHDVFALRAAAAPDRVAVCLGDRQLSYGELERRASRLAHALRDRGIGVDTRDHACRATG